MTAYFVSAKGRTDAPVKIGMTADLDKRLSRLLTATTITSMAAGIPRNQVSRFRCV